jgi:membrane protein implicated in regulation of membrane protease activity
LIEEPVVSTWQILAFIGVLFVIGEFFTASFALLPIGIAFLITALLSPFLGGWVAILAVLTVNLLLQFALFQRLVWPRLRHRAPATNAAGMVGKEAVVTEPVPPDSGSGYVALYGDRWQAVSVTGEAFSVGEKVRISAIDGNKVVVEKL